MGERQSLVCASARACLVALLPTTNVFGWHPARLAKRQRLDTLPRSHVVENALESIGTGMHVDAALSFTSAAYRDGAVGDAISICKGIAEQGNTERALHRW
eukprot:7333844-Alexandrium_andersonii.AAC.1